MNRRLKLFVLPIAPTSRPRCPCTEIHDQIAQIVQATAQSITQARLPSTRVMAGLLDVSRNTVVAAYDELAADDLARGERGSGMRELTHGR